MRTSLGFAMLAIGIATAVGCRREAPVEPDPASTAASVPATPAPAATAPATPAPVGTVPAGDASLVLLTSGVPQPHLADASGKALYFVEGDTDGSRCTGDCTRAWPPVLAMDAMPSGDANLQASLVGTIERADGSRQVTYNRHPLYRYAADTAAGSTAGNGVKDQWGSWHGLDATGEPLAVAKP